MNTKSFKTLIKATAAAALTFSCSAKEELPAASEKVEGYRPQIETVRMTFTSHLDGGGKSGATDGTTKTSLVDGTKVLWDSGDAISVIAESTRTGSTFNEVSVSADGRTASFSGETAASESYFAIYPAQAAQLATDFKTVTMDLPWSQAAVAGSFASGTNIALARSTETGELYFRNVGALLSFTITSTSKSIKAVRLTAVSEDGRCLTGRAAVELDDAGVPFVSDMLSTCGSVQLNGEFATGERYYFVVYPGEYKSLSISFISTDNKIAAFTSSNTLSLGRNKSRKIGDFTITDDKWESAGSNVYTRLNDSNLPSDYSGNYLIIYEDGNLAFDGSLPKLDAVNNGFEVSITDGTIPVTETTKAKEFTILRSGEEYSIRSASGLYIGQTSNANGLAADSSNAYDNYISDTGTIVSGGAYLRFNSSNDQMRFRYFKSGTYSAQKPIVLYRRDTGGGLTDPEQTEALPRILTGDPLDAAADGGSGTAPLTLVDADQWNVSAGCSGCVTAASISEDRSTISYTVRKNDSSSPDSGTIIITLSRTGYSDIIATIEVNQEAGEEQGETAWRLVTETSSLKAGDVLVLASNGKSAVAGALESSILQSVGATFSSDFRTIDELPSSAVIFKLMGDSGAWMFSSASGLLGTTAAKTLCWGNGTTTWTISIDSGSGRATVTSTEAGCGSLQYNNSSPRFTTYTSSQGAIQLYRRTSGTDDPPVQNPYVTTLNDIGNRTTSSATVSAEFFSGESVPSSAFFRYGTSADNLSQTKYASTPTSTSGEFSVTISGLAENSWCWYQACITVGGTTLSGSVCSFKTGSSSGPGTSGACRGWFELPAQNDTNKDGVDDDNSDYYYSWTMRADATSIRNFSSCYSKSKIHPVWVAAPMHSSYLGSSGRNDSYRNDPNIYCTQAAKFTGYTRGHMVGSSDRTVSVATNRQAFYYSNIGAQTSSGFNTGGGAWNNLEDFTDGQMCSDTLYQVIGCIFETFTDKYGSTVSKKTGTTGAGDTFQVPTAWYKILLRTKNGSSGKAVDQCSASELKCAAFILAHKGNSGHKPTANDIYTVAEVEELTGLTFFVNVPNAPKSTVEASDWGL